MKLTEMSSMAGPVAAASAVPEKHAGYPQMDVHHPLDLQLQSALAKMSAGLSPIGLSLAFQDWLLHLAASPGKQSELMAQLSRHVLEWGPALALAKSHSAEVAADTRFAENGWANWPFNLYAKGFVQTQEFWQQATSGVRGVSPHHARVVKFAARQWMDVFSPSNFALTNPEVLRASVDSKGHNYVSGWRHWMEDVKGMHAKSGSAPKVARDKPHAVGRDVALTPGKVVFRNELVELIQYAPQTADVYREPVLIVPSWIMKYYILDLSAHNSLVRYLVQQGHTVFMISWRNPDANDRNLGMDDYLFLGLLDVLREVSRIGAGAPLHAVGYCLGGTLLGIAAAAIGSGRHAGIAQLKSVTLLAAQTDFTDPGELGLFINDSELAFLDAMMWEKGYLDGAQMAGSFQMLNSRDLIWSHNMRQYMLGIRTVPNDLMAWNADTTRMPYRMHSEYLNRLFLHNDLAEGRYRVNGRAVALTDIRAPMYVLGAERDHVSPWRSVYKINLLSNTEVDFVLAAGGHNAGIVSEPGHARRSYKVNPHRPAGAAYVAPDEWLQTASQVDGSWWPHWQQWLVAHSDSERAAPPSMGAGVTLADAPGLYVLGT